MVEYNTRALRGAAPESHNEPRKDGSILAFCEGTLRRLAAGTLKTLFNTYFCKLW